MGKLPEERVLNPTDRSIWERVTNEKAARAFARGATVIVCEGKDSSPFAPCIARSLPERTLTKRHPQELLADRLDKYRRSSDNASSIARVRYFLHEDVLKNFPK